MTSLSELSPWQRQRALDQNMGFSPTENPRWFETEDGLVMGMLDTEQYELTLRGATYEDLAGERDHLYKRIRAYEEEGSVDPDFEGRIEPEEIYKNQLAYLGKVCEAMARLRSGEKTQVDWISMNEFLGGM